MLILIFQILIYFLNVKFYYIIYLKLNLLLIIINHRKRGYNTKLKNYNNHYVPFNNTNFVNESPIVMAYGYIIIT